MNPVPGSQQADSAGLLSAYLEQSARLCYFATDASGVFGACNAAAVRLLRVTEGKLLGQSLWNFLTDSDAAALNRRLHSGAEQLRERFVLHFVDAGGRPFELDCMLDVQPEGKKRMAATDYLRGLRQ